MTAAPELLLELESDVALRDGSVAPIRSIRADDEPHLLALLHGLSDEDRRLRFFCLGNDLSRTAHDEATVDNVWLTQRHVGHWALDAEVELSIRAG